VLGVLVTKYQAHTRIAREVMDALGKRNLPVFATVIPQRVGAEDNVGKQLMTGDHGAEPILSAAYEAVTQEVIARVEEGARV
jgi:cellulose biosynthesis protein BcsQ